MRKTVAEDACIRANKILLELAGLGAAGGFMVCILPGAAPAGPIKTVFVIAMENHNWTQPASQTSPGQIFGNPAAPYINNLVTPAIPMLPKSLTRAITRTPESAFIPPNRTTSGRKPARTSAC
jgi:hypothetical protein